MKNNQLKVSGENKVRTIEQFEQICKSEYLVKYNNMLAEFKEKKAGLEVIRDSKVEEYRLINMIVNTNSLKHDNKLTATNIIQVETFLWAINYETACQSFTLDFWRKELGVENAIMITVDVMSYFFRQFTVKESLDGAQMIQLTMALFKHHGDFRLKQLIHCLNEAVLGKYGAFYERLSIAKVSEWIAMYLESIATNAETEYYRTKPTESRGHNAVDPFEIELNKFKKLAKAKKDISDALYKQENHKEQVEKFKNDTLNNQQK